ncbi:MAG: DUF192 domain-containing protein [Thermodesulfobacteriota bacterium]
MRELFGSVWKTLTFAIVVGLGGLVGTVSAWAQTVQNQPLRKVSVTLGDTVVIASIAETDGARLRGLLGRETISEDQAMLLDFVNESNYAIHMQGMKFPIDAIWIDAHGEIKFIYQSVQPNSGEVYPSMVPARYCLETKAGLCRKYAVKIGQKVHFGPPTREKAPDTGGKPAK